MPDDFGEGQVWVGLGVPAAGDERRGLLWVEEEHGVGGGEPLCQELAVLGGALVPPVGVPAVKVGESGSEPCSSLLGGGL